MSILVTVKAHGEYVGGLDECDGLRHVVCVDEASLCTSVVDDGDDAGIASRQDDVTVDTLHRGLSSPEDYASKFFKDTEGFENSYVVSIDTWLLDVKFAWNGPKSVHKEKVSGHRYFAGDRLAAGSQMYYQFLANCIESKTEDRIIPLPTSSSNGAMTLLSHGVRPDFMYIDASHANPDVFIDYENFYTLLKPGGVMPVDDLKLPAVKTSFNLLVERYGLELIRLNGNQGYVMKLIINE